MNYGKAIARVRKEHMRQKQYEFAEGVGTSQAYLSLVETGKKEPSTDLLNKIATYTGMPIPIMFWHGISEEDIPEAKREIYRMLKPIADAILKTIV